jgi:pyruvate dehydrogenase E2 component (dihydrolipoamide acetyltransferase)
MHEILMPRLSDTMETGRVSRWLISPGDTVEKGDAMFEVETDKASVIVEAEVSGILHIAIPEGVDAAVGEVVGSLVGSSESLPELSAGRDWNSGPTIYHASPSPEAAHTPGVHSDTPAGDGNHNAQRDSLRPRVSPAARRLSEELSVRLSDVAGKGPGGRILKSDVIRAHRSRPGERQTLSRLSRMQEAIARNTTAAKRTIPHFYLSIDVDVTSLKEFRAESDRAPLSVTDLVIRACAMALRANPGINAFWSPDGLMTNDQIDIGIAVALEGGGLVVPVIRSADRLSLSNLNREARRVIDAARDGELRAADIDGGTFTVSNLGAFGVREFYAIILPPQSGILAIGQIVTQPVVREGRVVIREIMSLSLSADHRVYSGASGARFLGDLKKFLEDPSRLVGSEDEA